MKVNSFITSSTVDGGGGSVIGRPTRSRNLFVP